MAEAIRSIVRVIVGRQWPDQPPRILSGSGWVRSDFLVGQPSILTGIARLIDLGGSFDAYNMSPTPAQADARALYNDWRVIGQDLIATADQIDSSNE